VRTGFAPSAARWVAPPGHSLHRYGTELDLGPPSAYDWLARNAGGFHFIKRYECKRWLPQRMGSGASPDRLGVSSEG
jgi:hypothetical protein